MSRFDRLAPRRVIHRLAARSLRLIQTGYPPLSSTRAPAPQLSVPAQVQLDLRRQPPAVADHFVEGA